MSKKYFPGANTGIGFVSRFSGIMPHYGYTYILKGGPGVGKSTLMRRVADGAAAAGLTVEEFRCASDPSSLDAVRIVERNIALLDGTAPHTLDPSVPGIDSEIIDLGHFKDKDKFAKHRSELETLFKANKACYRHAYSLLGAARSLKHEALLAARDTLDVKKLREFLKALLGRVEVGKHRELFARSATPHGEVDLSESFIPENTVYLSGILGEAALTEALRMLQGHEALVGYGYVTEDTPTVIAFGDSAIAKGEGETLIGLCHSPLPKHIPSMLEESERLAKQACDALAGALAAHDRIEEIYREYVHYGKVNNVSEELIHELGL